jgi:predicted esterase
MKSYRINKSLIVFVISVVLLQQSVFGAELTSKPSLIKTEDYLLYIPAKIDPEKKYPLVIAFAPDADAWKILSVWKNVSEKLKWIIYADHRARNGSDILKACDRTSNNVKVLEEKYPIDKTRIIAYGFSGGAMIAYGLTVLYPTLISSVIVNTGVIHAYFKRNKQRYLKRKLAVLIASPTDFHYKEMNLNKEFLDDLKWTTHWLEFSQGHDYAPTEVYIEAAEWLNSKLENMP